MSRFRRSLCGLTLSATMVGLFAIPAQPSQDSVLLTPDQKVYAFVRNFLLAAYPDLPVGKCTWRITISSPMDRLPDAVGDVDTTVVGPVVVPMKGGRLRQLLTKELVDGLFIMNRSGVLEQVSLQGEWTSWEKYRKLIDLVNAHPEWSEGQAVQALRKAGAKYGPVQKKALMQKIPVQELSRALGVNLSLRSVEFHAFVGKHVGSFADMTWAANFQGKVGGKTLNYVATFEPFGGRLTFLSRMPL